MFFIKHFFEHKNKVSPGLHSVNRDLYISVCFLKIAVSLSFPIYLCLNATSSPPVIKAMTHQL